MAEEVNEMGLLDDFAYEVEDPQGLIDESDNTFLTQQKKKPLSPKDKIKQKIFKKKEKDEQQLQVNNNNNNNNNNVQQTKLTQCQIYCTGVFYWIPIRNLCFFGGVALFVLPIIDAKFSSLSFMEWMLSWYIWIFAIITMFIESPTWFLTQRVQLKIFFYARFLRRSSGRAFFYTTTSFLTFATESVSWTMFAGIYMILMSILLMCFSVLASKQLHLMYDYMVNNDENDDEQQYENQIINKIQNHYIKLDVNRNKKVGANQLHEFSQNALNRKLSNSERYTLQCYLDVSCNGFINEEDWTKQFLNSTNVKFL